LSGLNRMPTGISCIASIGRDLTAPPVSNCLRWNSWRSWQRSYPCRVPTWCAMQGVWHRIASSGRRSFRHRANRVSTASKRRREPRIGTGQGCSAAPLIWLWRPARCAAVVHCASLPPFFRHCVGGGKRADALRRRSRARPCDLHPGVGDHAYSSSLQVGVRSTSHCPCPLSPRDMCVRRGPRQRGLIGDVRAAAEYFA